MLDKFWGYHVKEQAFFYKPTNFQSFWSKNKNFPEFLVRPCILTPSEYSFLENPIFIQFIITPKQIVVSFYFFFFRRSRQPLWIFWALTHCFYWLAVHAVTSSNFVISAPVESRDRGGNDEPKNCWYLQKEKS